MNPLIDPKHSLIDLQNTATELRFNESFMGMFVIKLKPCFNLDIKEKFI